MDDFPLVAGNDLAWLSTAQMIEVDRVMVEDLHIDLVQMMENAGRHLATLTYERYKPNRVTVLAGRGGNGGGGLVAARHLANWGVAVTVTTSHPADHLDAVTAHQLEILRRMGVPTAAVPPPADLVIDALIGYRLQGPPRGRIEHLIRAVASVAPTVVSLDNPSGLDVTNGSVPGAVVTADATLTLAMPKHGLHLSAHVGELFLADISVPPDVYRTIGAEFAPPFAGGPILAVLRS